MKQVVVEKKNYKKEFKKLYCLHISLYEFFFYFIFCYIFCKKGGAKVQWLEHLVLNEKLVIIVRSITTRVFSYKFDSTATSHFRKVAVAAM